MNTPYNDIFKVANASGSILGISKNLLGGPDSIIEYFSPGGELGSLERLIKSGDTLKALEKLMQIRQQIDSIKAHVKEIN